LFFAVSVFAQQFQSNREYYIATIGFWNVENLYDTLNDQWKNDEDFTPVGLNAWNGERYRTKLKNLSYAIAQMGKEHSEDGLAILGLCEVENKMVVEDLINTPELKNRNYKIVHIEGPDARGVDPSFVYNPKYFKVLKALAYPVVLLTDSAHKTRDILVVSGLFLGEPMSFLVNHWPSRRGGEMSSRPNRNRAGEIVRHIADSITSKDTSAKVIIMGDLNDDPVNESIKKKIGTFSNLKASLKNGYYNPMEKLYKGGVGSLAWQDTWNLFDQILLNHKLLPGVYETWQFYSVRVFNKTFLSSDLPSDKGYPFRTFAGAKYLGGYSDHFPVYIIIAKEKLKSER
jgi:hypothetical protein